MVKRLFDFLVTAMETENSEQVSLATASSEYDQASQAAKKCYKKMQEILPPEMQKTLLRCKLCSKNR